MRDLIEKVKTKNKVEGVTVHQPIDQHKIKTFEDKVGFKLPEDFKKFYLICNGFECTEDQFTFTSIENIIIAPKGYKSDYSGKNWFYFSEYMTFCDMWGLRITDEGKYEIFNGSFPEFTLTNSLKEFLNKFIKGNVFENGGLYDWLQEIKNSN